MAWRLSKRPLLAGALALTCAGLVVAQADGPRRASADDARRARELREQVDAALQQARPALLAHLKAAATESTRVGELALLCLAALHDGVPSDDELLARALDRLMRGKPDQTYDIALRLCVLEACPRDPERLELARSDATTLLHHRSRAGGFQYTRSPSTWDLSATQYGTLGLRAAASMGCDIDRSVWRRLGQLVLDQQCNDGSFGYGPLRARDGYASMTAAGIAVLAICRERLGDAANGTGLDRGIERGWHWFAANPDCIGSERESWSYYFHYGLERAAILCDVEQIDGGIDWYERGARMLIDAQLAGGGWQSTSDGYPGGHLSQKRGSAVPTAFAVLFLRRKFQKVPTGPITPHIVTIAAVGPKSKQADVDACAAELVRRGHEAAGDIVKGLRSDVEPRRRAAAKALQGIAGDTFGFDPALELDANRTALHRAELWFLRNRPR